MSQSISFYSVLDNTYLEKLDFKLLDIDAEYSDDNNVCKLIINKEDEHNNIFKYYTTYLYTINKKYAFCISFSYI